VDNIAVPRATEKKIPVMNTASANSLAAAELTIALMLGAFRQLGEASASLKAGKWERDKFKGREVTGKTLGLLGIGNIGGIVAQKAIGLGMRVIAFDPARKGASGVNGVTLLSSPVEVAKEADVLSVHVPKVKATENLVNAELLGAMKSGSYLVNCARGGVVDEAATIAALDSGKLAGAAFDVFVKEPPVFPNALIAHPKVLAVPHLGASTVEAQDRVALTAAQQMVGFFTRGDRTGVIN
jgi:phosphoglycerate dehydrogenase-like enzyme